MKLRIIFTEKINPKYLVELFFTIRFALIGLLATGIHVITLWLLLSNSSLSVVVANTLAFLLAFCFSFSGHYLWTFEAKNSLKVALPKFLVVSLAAFFFNSVFLVVLLKANLVSPIFSAIGSIAIIPAFTFIVSRFWVFQHTK